MKITDEKPTNIQIKLSAHSRVPKYVQVADSIANDILTHKIKQGQRLPSINDLSHSSSFSRDTIEKAYKVLKGRDLIFAIHNVGYFATIKDFESRIKVLFLVNKPSVFKLEVYNAFMNALGNEASVEMCLYFCEEEIFIEALEKHSDNCDYFVIMPHFKSNIYNYISYPPNVIRALESISTEKRIIIDNYYEEIPDTVAAIYQDYEQDIFYALEEALLKLQKYDKLILVYPTKLSFPFPVSILDGFILFCEQHCFDFEIIEDIKTDINFNIKCVFITIEDGNLVKLLNQIKENKVIIGKEVGIVSYNDTPLKSIMGISVFSTDFKKMGKTAAEFILKNKKEIVKNPFNYIERNSL